MNERIMQDLLRRCPQDLIEEGLSFSDREVSVGNRRLDLVFTDRRGRLLLVEVQQGSLDTKHIDRHIDFVEGFLERNPDVDVRLMYIANRIDALRKSFLDRRGYEHLEIPAARFIALAKDQEIEDKHESEQQTGVGEDVAMSSTRISKGDLQAKRKQFISSADTPKEKEFWTLFFAEIDKRSPWVMDAFKETDNFGVRIDNKKHFEFGGSGGTYSLMYTRKHSLRMNDTGYQGRKWNGLDRLKKWCVTPGLPERFYSALKARKLTDNMEWILVPDLVSTRGPHDIVKDLFACIDLFR
jgi:hypothetical protein